MKHLNPLSLTFASITATLALAAAPANANGSDVSASFFDYTGQQAFAGSILSLTTAARTELVSGVTTTSATADATSEVSIFGTTTEAYHFEVACTAESPVGTYCHTSFTIGSMSIMYLGQSGPVDSEVAITMEAGPFHVLSNSQLYWVGVTPVMVTISASVGVQNDIRGWANSQFQMADLTPRLHCWTHGAANATIIFYPGVAGTQAALELSDATVDFIVRADEDLGGHGHIEVSMAPLNQLVQLWVYSNGLFHIEPIFAWSIAALHRIIPLD